VSDDFTLVSSLISEIPRIFSYFSVRVIAVCCIKGYGFSNYWVLRKVCKFSDWRLKKRSNEHSPENNTSEEIGANPHCKNLRKLLHLGYKPPFKHVIGGDVDDQYYGYAGYERMRVLIDS